MPKKIAKGGIMHRRTVLVWGGDEGPDDLLDGACSAAHPPSFEACIARIERWTQRVMKREHARETPVAHYDIDDDSLRSYAERIGLYAAAAMDYFRQGDVNQAAVFALVIGELVGEARITFPNEPLVQKGLTRQADAAKGGKRAADELKQKAAAWQEKILPKVRRLIAAGKSDLDIAGKVCPETGRSMETVRKFVAKEQKAFKKNSW